MADNFITIREATTLTGKADITIRRLIKQVIKQNNPETTQVIRQEQAGKGFVYKINKDYLLKELEINEPIKEPEIKKEFSDTIKKEGAETPNIVKEVIKTLKDQLYIKDKQIDNLSTKIDSLIERDRETNIILNNLQSKVFMLEEGKEPRETIKEATEANISEKQAIKEDTNEEKPTKEGFWKRLFKSDL